jgi:hypothetical protein
MEAWGIPVVWWTSAMRWLLQVYAVLSAACNKL